MDALLFTALARAAERRMEDFEAQELTNTAWAFATAGEPTPALLDPILVLDVMEVRGAKPELLEHHMLMQALAVTCQIEVAFGLLARVEASGLLSHFDNDCYPMLRTLLEACRFDGDSNGASRVQASVDRLGLIALAPLATARVQGSLRRYENGVAGEGVADARQLWVKLCV